MHPEELFLTNLGLIERIIRSTCSRHRSFDAEADDFASIVKLRLIENDYSILRQYEGRSSFPTYLYIVIQRLYLDHRDHLWGKWRPSAEARRSGKIGTELERSITREGMTRKEAIDDALRRHPETTRAEAEAIVSKLPSRIFVDRQGTDIAALESLASPDRADASLDAAERSERARRIDEVLSTSLQSLEQQDRMILKLRFVDGLRLSTISRTLGIDQRFLYRRVDRLFATLRLALVAAGVERSDVRAVIDDDREEIRIDFEAEGEKGHERPSHLPAAKGAAAMNRRTD
jgi:RNA polymerase sigma factor (sigma-70 family)